MNENCKWVKSGSDYWWYCVQKGEIDKPVETQVETQDETENTLWGWIKCAFACNSYEGYNYLNNICECKGHLKNWRFWR
jgi:hypothetical protein